MTRIALISDVHGNLPALEAVVADLAARGLERVVNLGDHASGPLWPAETVRFLRRQPWVQIAGNHDRQVVATPPETHGASDRYAFAHLGPEEKAWLAALPATAELPEGVLLCHGTPSDDRTFLLETVEHGRLRLAEPGELAARLGPATHAVVACGHSHVPRWVSAAATIVVNPGSVGLQAYADTEPAPYASETGSPHARYAILDDTAAGWRATWIAVSYDHEEAAAKAQREGRADWAYALRSGRASS
jgi:predicted phosphodiesterase